MMFVTSGVSDSPTATVRRFRFQVAASRERKVQARRREAVVEYLTTWLPLRVIAEHDDGARLWLWIELRHPVEVQAATDYAKECPGYAAKSFKVLR